MVRVTDTTRNQVQVERNSSILRKNRNQHPSRTFSPTKSREHASGPISNPTPTAEREEVIYNHVPNIVVFGETGVGKSSIINLIADRKLAGTSNDAVGCTFQHKRYPVALGDVSCALWDTAGLDEGTEGTVPAQLAEENLRELMRALARSGGIHLIIYCIRGTRITKALKRNYDLFYVAVCRRQVPVALVVTGLEYQLGEMESWWDKNEAALMRYGMRFDAHACVTTLNLDDGTIQQRRSDSQILLRKLIVEYSGRSGWTINPSFMSSVLPTLRAFFREGSSLANPARGNTSMRKVAICDSFTYNYRRGMEQIGNRQYEFIRVAKHTLQGPRKLQKKEHGGMNVGLLVFYAASPVDYHILQDDADILKRFYKKMGGWPRPIIVVLRNCEDQRLAQSWHNLTSHHGIPVTHTVTLPSTLNEIVQTWYPEHEVNGSNSFKDSVAGKCF